MMLYKCKYHNKEFGERCVEDIYGREKELCELFCFDADDVISIASHIKEYYMAKPYRSIFPEEFLDTVLANKDPYDKFVKSRQGANIFAFIQIMHSQQVLQNFAVDFYSTVCRDYFKHSGIDAEFTYYVNHCRDFTKEELKAAMPHIDTSGAYGNNILFRDDQDVSNGTNLAHGVQPKKLTGISLYNNSGSDHAMYIVVNNYTKEIFYLEPNFAKTIYASNYNIYFNYFADSEYPTYKKITSEEIGKEYGYLAQSVTNNNTCVLWSIIICLYIIINYDKPIKNALGYIIDAKENVGPTMLLFLYYAHVLGAQSDSVIDKHKDEFITYVRNRYNLYTTMFKTSQPHLHTLPLLNLSCKSLNDAYLIAAVNYVIDKIKNEKNMQFLLKWDPHEAGKLDIVDFYNVCTSLIEKSKYEPRLFGVDSNYFISMGRPDIQYTPLSDATMNNDPYNGASLLLSTDWLVHLSDDTYMEAGSEIGGGSIKLINPFSEISNSDISSVVNIIKSNKIMRLFKIANKKYGNATGFRAIYEKIVSGMLKTLGVDVNFKVVELDFDNMKSKYEIDPGIWRSFYPDPNSEPDSAWWPVDLETGNIANNIIYSEPIVLFRIITGNRYSWLIVNKNTKEITYFKHLADDKFLLFMHHISQSYGSGYSKIYSIDYKNYMDPTGPKYISYSWCDVVAVIALANNTISMYIINSIFDINLSKEYAFIGLFWYLIYIYLYECNDLKEVFYAEQFTFCFSRALEYEMYISHSPVDSLMGEYENNNKTFVFPRDLFKNIQNNLNKLIEFSNSNIAQKICSNILFYPAKYITYIYSDIIVDLLKHANISATVENSTCVFDAVSSIEAKNRIPELANYITTESIVMIPRVPINLAAYTKYMNIPTNVVGLDTHGYINIISCYKYINNIMCIVVNHNTREVILNESIENFKDVGSYIPYVKFFVDTYCQGYELKRVLSMVSDESINKFEAFASANRECSIIYHLINIYVMTNYNAKLEIKNIEDILGVIAKMSGLFWFYLFVLRVQKGSIMMQMLN